jgi:hypothetical protein
VSAGRPNLLQSLPARLFTNVAATTTTAINNDDQANDESLLTTSSSKRVLFEDDTTVKERLEQERQQEEEERERQKQEALLKPIFKSGKLFNLFRKYGKFRNRRILPILPLFRFGKMELECTNIKMGPTRSVLLIICIDEVELFQIKKKQFGWLLDLN